MILSVKLMIVALIALTLTSHSDSHDLVHHILTSTVAIKVCTAHAAISVPLTFIRRMRVDRCDFSGFKVYPSKGKTYVRGDSKVSTSFRCSSICSRPADLPLPQLEERVTLPSAQEPSKDRLDPGLPKVSGRQ